MFPEEDQKRRSEKSSKYYMVYLKMNKKSYEKAIGQLPPPIEAEACIKQAQLISLSHQRYADGATLCRNI
ncbi:MAG: hypothetical protein ACK4J2_08730 [Sulfurihydrogenibium azorense]|uniref:hypothetical protein n=1 Tax=Sulfurihydrogenibium azorense TaxID=309806 RepID=UPI00391B08FC